MTAPILPPTDESIRKAVRILNDGGLVAMPTETVYGLACDAANPAAVARLYEVKGRPSFNPLIVHVPPWPKKASTLFVDLPRRIGKMNLTAIELAAQGWPGPLTLVVPINGEQHVCDLARAGLDSVAMRMPAHPVAQQLLTAFGRPLVAPSANRSGKISPTRAEHVAADLGEKIDLILDGGPCKIGLESTILSCLTDPPGLLRHGAFDASAYTLAPQDETKPLAPGGLSRHYAPNATLRLNAAIPVSGDAYLAFGPSGDLPAWARQYNLSETGDLTEAAANLFAMLRTLDRTHARIAVAPIPMQGLGLAINDRLARAAKRD